MQVLHCNMCVMVAYSNPCIVSYSAKGNYYCIAY